MNHLKFIEWDVIKALAINKQEMNQVLKSKLLVSEGGKECPKKKTSI